MRRVICFVTTGDIKDIATAKRALGLANPMSELGWSVSIIMEDSVENRHRVSMECNASINIYYFAPSGAFAERRVKDKIIREIDPTHLYICAFVARNIVGLTHPSQKLVEHSELQSRIADIGVVNRFMHYALEYISIIYADAILNASKYLHNIYESRQKRILFWRRSSAICTSKLYTPMLYSPYGYNPSVMSIIDKDRVDVRFKNMVETINLLYLGSITKDYGVFTILEAVKCLVSERMQRMHGKECDKFKVQILGKGADRDAAIAYVERHGLDEFIDMPGFVDEEDLASYFSLASAFISPMHDTIQDWARCPSKIYMYLPYQKPIITCRIGEPYEILRSQGYYYDYGDALQMAQQIKRVIESPENRLDIDASMHTWQARATQIDLWIKENKI